MPGPRGDAVQVCPDHDDVGGRTGLGLRHQASPLHQFGSRVENQLDRRGGAAQRRVRVLVDDADGHGELPVVALVEKPRRRGSLGAHHEQPDGPLGDGRILFDTNRTPRVVDHGDRTGHLHVAVVRPRTASGLVRTQGRRLEATGRSGQQQRRLVHLITAAADGQAGVATTHGAEPFELGCLDVETLVPQLL